ncbi:conserved hypothetical protein [Hahella chejuensis KCTC 2396]|uniref:Uncharacterized protein n=1 Tax=Hahella chejuensis (strain KCTC 2396) TaxID=349521 RepID=Q2SFK5_HAHCH|nr:hypothetical protein [Hahella chejuensis]ABC30569.1 conserved hypothetical protein [Hahella chejuensis KCTC 2396]
MHDWTLVALAVDWQKGAATITLKNSRSEDVFIVADGLANLVVPRREAWGGSVSVNAVEGPRLLTSGDYYLALDMQSGDKIELEARAISPPASQCD